MSTTRKLGKNVSLFMNVGADILNLVKNISFLWLTYLRLSTSVEVWPMYLRLSTSVDAWPTFLVVLREPHQLPLFPFLSPNPYLSHLLSIRCHRLPPDFSSTTARHPPPLELPPCLWQLDPPLCRCHRSPYTDIHPRPLTSAHAWPGPRSLIPTRGCRPPLTPVSSLAG
jgi:hypothetical protein